MSGPRDVDRALGWGILVWAAVATAILAVIHDVPSVVFTLVFGFGFGGVAYRFRDRIRPAFHRARLDGFLGFSLLVVGISVGEELLVYVLGGRLAESPVALDLLWVGLLWWTWLATWYWAIRPRFLLSERRALLVGGATGILYEIGLSRAFLDGPGVILVFAPVAWLVYGAIFVLPLQLMPTEGARASRWSVPAALLVPFAASLAVALVLYALLSVLGVPVH
jgi:hypothetical protein